jgi:hypothetical protein
MAGVAAAAGEKSRSVLPLFIAVLLIPAVIGSSKTIFNDGDVSWHIATGQWILGHGAIPHTDPFSFTWFGKPWVPMEWLADVSYASAYGLAHYGGLAAVVTAALMALHAIVYLNARRWLRLALVPLVGMDFLLIPMLVARPHVLTWPILALWLWQLLRARSQDRAPSLWWALLLTLWSNLHASFAMGLLIAGAFGVEALVASPDRTRAFRQWALFGLACLAAFCINPHGIHGLLYPLGFTKLQMLPLIDEWKPSSIHKTPFFFGVLAITLAIIVWKRPRLPWVRWLLLAALLGLALLQVRHQAMFAIVAAMVLPQGFAKAERQPPTTSGSLPWISATAAVLLLVVRVLVPLQPPDNESNPWHLIAQVPPELRSQPVLNGYSMGGPLILSGIRPYIDGRSDMYGDELVVGFSHIAHGDRRAFETAVRKWNIRWAMIPNDSKAFTAMLDSTPGWRRIARDKVGAIYIRAT